MLTVVPIVEGDGDAAALPQLLHRILHERFQRYDVTVAQGKSNVVKSNGRQKLEKDFDKFLRYAQIKPSCDAILILVDSDRDCPVDLRKRYIELCDQVGVLCPIEIVCAQRTFESWFIASVDTIKGFHGISETAVLPDGVDEIQNPKQWLSSQMPSGQSYKETIHQLSFSNRIDLELAYSRSRSFRRLCHALELLLPTSMN